MAAARQSATLTRTLHDHRAAMEPATIERR
jgi:hypothetical protein